MNARVKNDGGYSQDIRDNIIILAFDSHHGANFAHFATVLSRVIPISYVDFISSTNIIIYIIVHNVFQYILTR